MSTPTLPLIPIPTKVTAHGGGFSLTASTQIEAPDALRALAERLRDALRLATGFPLPVVTRASGPRITLGLDEGLARIGVEGYRLAASAELVAIAAARPVGVMHGTQTLRQLLPPAIFRRAVVPGGSKRYPKLTEVGAWRKDSMIPPLTRDPANRKFSGQPHGGFYTQDDVREVVRYAMDRGVTVVPEIEMPGHALAAIAAYPELGNTDTKHEVQTYWGISEHVFGVGDNVLTFLENVLEEVLALFPSKFIHVGGDECPKTEWKASAAAQARMKQLGLKDEDQLQSWFITHMDKWLAARGRRLIGWDEILEGGLAPGATVMSWRGERGGVAAAKAGHDVVMAPEKPTYFDYDNSENEPLPIRRPNTLAEVYAYEPVPKELSAAEAKHVLGAQGQLWTEYMPDPQRMEYMAWPRLCALAEVLWSPPETRDAADFARRLEAHLERMGILDVNYWRPRR